MAKFRCKPCGYIYDEETGDYESGIEAGTKFKDLPENWLCPICYLGKNYFEDILG